MFLNRISLKALGFWGTVRKKVMIKIKLFDELANRQNLSIVLSLCNFATTLVFKFPTTLVDDEKVY